MPPFQYVDLFAHYSDNFLPFPTQTIPAGVRYDDADGGRRELRAKLVIGADGRRSTVAAQVGAWQPYRVSRNGRGLIFRYMDDPLADTDTWSDFASIPVSSRGFISCNSRIITSGLIYAHDNGSSVFFIQNRV